MNQIVIQGIGFLAYSFIFISFQNNKRATLLPLLFTGDVLFVIHFLLLKALTGAAVSLIAAAVAFVSYKKTTDKWAKQKLWIYIFISLYITAGVVTAKTTMDYLPIIAQILGVISVWQKSTRAIRFTMLLILPLWIIYCIIVGSYSGIIGELIVLSSVIIGIIRFDIKKETLTKKKLRV